MKQGIFMEWLFNFIGGLGGLMPIIGIVLLVIFWRQSIAQEYNIPPLDLADAKKLDDMVSKQVEIVLKPMLQSKGYTEAGLTQLAHCDRQLVVPLYCKQNFLKSDFFIIVNSNESSKFRLLIFWDNN
ncbi:hypothetical protein BLD44_015100 [Mastigocladus laminosus UU774]|nr:hypothetical protein BLD44_015100 [Mastigocladus laminosus UU774]